MNLVGRAAVALATAGIAASVLASPASADTVGPAVAYWKSALPIVGGTLSDSTATPSLSIKDGWAVNDGDGICSGYADLYQGSTRATSRVWNAPSTGRTVTSLIGNTVTWTTRVGYYDYLRTYATDCLGNATNYSSLYVSSSLAQENAASYGAGWSTSACTCFSGGSVLKSCTVGATANYTFYGSLVSLVSNSASNRGRVSLSVDGGAAETVTLTGGTVNRKVVWNSKYLSTTGSHLLTVKVVSGRVNIDGFLTQS